MCGGFWLGAFSFKVQVTESKFNKGGDEVKLEEIPDLANFESLCESKVIGVGAAMKVGKGLEKQDCVVADSTWLYCGKIM